MARVYHGTSEVDAVASFHPPSVSIGRKMHGKKVHLSTAVGLNYALPSIPPNDFAAHLGNLCLCHHTYRT